MLRDVIVVHHIEKRINGRDYRIEVASVDEHTWRAKVVTIYGGPTALMPFYGTTPDDAAERLSEWLTRAHRNASGAV